MIDFLKRVFDAEELGEPVYGEDGRIGHAEVRIGDSVVKYVASADIIPSRDRV